MFKKILVPLDGSAESNSAIPAARTTAKATGGSLTLLRVLQPPTFPENHNVTADAMLDLHRITLELASSGIQSDSVVRHGDAAAEILQQSHAETADLIVMRTHGRVGLERALLGSVTQQVLKDSGAPVLLVRPGGRRLVGVRKLLVPVDGSPGGAVALATAVKLSRATGASIQLLEVAVPITKYFYAYAAGGMTYFDPAWDEEALNSAESYIAGLVKQLRTSGLAADGEARMAPDVAATIATLAEEEGADLVIMSTQALTGPARALLGSVADAVVRTAPCPVLLVHRTPNRQHPTENHHEIPAAETSAAEASKVPIQATSRWLAWPVRSAATW